MTKKIIRRVSDLLPDKKNANKGTERGRNLLEHSLRTYGTGRSILVDKHGQIIAGNKTAEESVDVGLEDVIVVESDGKKLVVVQRTDLDLNKDKSARALAIADNRVGQIDLDWDADVLLALKDEGIDLTLLGFNDPDIKPEPWEEAWRGMPEYANEDERPVRTLFVHFKSAKHVAAFAQLLKQTITDETKSLWFPKVKKATTPKKYVGRKTK